MHSSLSLLITTARLDKPGGAEYYLRDLALGLQRRGHRPAVFSPRLGRFAERLRADGVPVFDDLGQLTAPPDVIHGQHHPQTMEAMLHFPRVPAVFVCHAFTSWQTVPPLFPRVRRYVAVDDVCREKLLTHGVEEARVRVVQNAVDLQRFTPRPALPERPRRALIFTNYPYDVDPVRAACARAGIELDEAGAPFGKRIERPEEMLGQYDLVFAKARAALEAMAVGAAVIVCDYTGVGGLVTAADFDRMRRLNFGMRTMTRPHDARVLAAEIARYDAADAAAVSLKVRATANLDLFLTTMTELYEEAIAEQRLAAYDPDGESRAAAAYLRDWGFERRYEWERTRLLRALPRPLVNLIIRLVLRYKDTDWWAART